MSSPKIKLIGDLAQFCSTACFLAWQDSESLPGRGRILRACCVCGNFVKRKGAEVSLYPKTYCSTKCRSEYMKAGEYVNCHTCGKKIWRTNSQIQESKSGNLFCSKSCSTIHRNSLYGGKQHPNYTNGTGSYRRKALRKLPNVCSATDCPLVEVPVEMLDVHHIDGNRKNNKLSNLVVLCVWCHARVTRGLLVLDK